MRSWLLGAALLLSACSSGVAAVYEGCATDENVASLDDAVEAGKVKSGDVSAPLWQAPAGGVDAPAGAPLVLRWRRSAAVLGADGGDVLCSQPTGFLPAAWTAGPVSFHLPPISGTIYDLQFRQGGATLRRVATSLQVVTVPADVVAGWAGKDLTVELVSVRFLSNDITEGPYRGAALPLRVR